MFTFLQALWISFQFDEFFPFFARSSKFQIHSESIFLKRKIVKVCLHLIKAVQIFIQFDDFCSIQNLLRHPVVEIRTSFLTLKQINLNFLAKIFVFLSFCSRQGKRREVNGVDHPKHSAIPYKNPNTLRCRRNGEEIKTFQSLRSQQIILTS